MPPDRPVPPAPVGGDFADTVSLMRAVAGAHPDREAFVEADRRLSFGAWEQAADSLARYFESSGVELGDVVGLVLPSCIDYAVCYQAAMRLGAITSGLNPRLGSVEVRSILERTRPVVLVVDLTSGRAAEVALDWASTMAPSTRVVKRENLAGIGQGPAPRRLVKLAASDPVAVVWTSGTTGIPKGAVFDHANLKAISEGIGVLSEMGDRRLSPLPFAHVGYMTRPWDELAHVITTVITPSPWRAEEALDLMAAERVSVAQGVPTQWSLMLDHPKFASTDLSWLRLAGTGASVVSPTLVARMRHDLGVPIVVRYTSTEAALTTGTGVGDTDEQVANSVGRAAGNVELKLVDASGDEIEPGQVGTLCCRSGAVMRRYWDDPVRTAEVLSPEGWLRTGDLGYFDVDGYLHLVGRHSEMYIRGGYNVYPAEIEKVLAGHGSIDHVAVLGHPDPVLGEIGVAFVVTAAGARRVGLDEVRQFCRDRLADYKAPDRMVFMAELPLTSMLKVDKMALADHLDHMDDAGGEPSGGDPQAAASLEMTKENV